MAKSSTRRATIYINGKEYIRIHPKKIVSSPRQKPPMNRRRTYRPQTAQIPADPHRGDPYDPRDPRRFPCDPRRSMNPLTGIWSTFATVPGYRDASPNGERHHPAAIVHCSLYIVHCPWSYTFSAKERDSETSLSYFGSRYYNSDLSIWLSVDPMSGKYPSLSPYVYCADNPVRVVDPNGEDWYENELTGDVYYNRDYRKGDEKLLEGKGWKWMGNNNMFEKNDNDAINSNLDKASNVSCRQDGVNGIASATFKGDKAETFMNNMGYEKRPLVQDVAVKRVTQTFPDAMGPNSFSHTETSEYTIKTLSWTYAKSTSAIRYRVLSRENVNNDINFLASIHTYSATEKRMYDYSMSSDKQSVMYLFVEILKTVSKMF